MFDIYDCIAPTRFANSSANHLFLHNMRDQWLINPNFYVVPEDPPQRQEFG